MEERSKIICITCPKGCSLQVTHDGKTVLKVEGAGCNRGKDYAQRELTDPRRMVATTVVIRHGTVPLMPVYTSAPFPKPRIRELLTALRQVEVDAPMKMGTVVLSNALGEGVDVIASRDVPQA